MCSVIDNQLFAQRQTKKRSGYAPRQNKPIKNRVETKTYQQLAVTVTHSGHMDTSAGAALAGKARTEWRKAINLCPYCGDKHKLQVCPKRAARNSRAAAAITTPYAPTQVLYSTAPSEN
jgi:NADH pyrophosphatase NudC (nudix superfamily)